MVTSTVAEAVAQVATLVAAWKAALGVARGGTAPTASGARGRAYRALAIALRATVHAAAVDATHDLRAHGESGSGGGR